MCPRATPVRAPGLKGAPRRCSGSRPVMEVQIRKYSDGQLGLRSRTSRRGAARNRLLRPLAGRADAIGSARSPLARILGPTLRPAHSLRDGFTLCESRHSQSVDYVNPTARRSMRNCTHPTERQFTPESFVHARSRITALCGEAGRPSRGGAMAVVKPARRKRAGSSVVARVRASGLCNDAMGERSNRARTERPVSSASPERPEGASQGRSGLGRLRHSIPCPRAGDITRRRMIRFQ